MKTTLRWVIYIALFTIPFLALYVANGLFFPFITGKGFAFRILVEIALFAWILLACADPAYRPRFSWTLILYAVFVSWIFIADVFGVNPHKALWSNFERMEGWVTLVHVFAFFLVTASVFTTDKLWRKWWLTFVAVAALVCCYCLLQLSGAITIHQGGVRVDGTFGNAAYLAVYLLFGAAVALWQAFESKGFLRYSLFVLSFVEVVILFFTATRGAVLGLVGAIGLGALLWMVESGSKGKKVAGGIFVALVIVAGGFYLLRESAFVQSEPTLQRISSISIGDLKVRFTLWGMAVKGVSERPLTGWGQEGFNYIFNEHYVPSMYRQEPWFDRAHNVFIDWLVAGGIPGFLLFVALLISAVRALYMAGATRPERVMLVAALGGYAIQGLVVFDNLFTYVPLAAILATAHSVSSRPWKKIEALPVAREATLQVATPIVAVFAATIIWMVNVPNIAASNELIHAMSFTSNDLTSNVDYFKQALAENTYAKQEIREQLIMFTSNVANQQQGPSQAMTQLGQFAMEEMGKEVATQPKDARIRLEYALGYRALGDYEHALEQIGIAHELSPKKQGILLEQGINYWQVNKWGEARASFHQAYDLDHSFPELAAYAAAGDLTTGHLQEGTDLLLQTVGTTTVDSEPLILAYYQVKMYPELIHSLQLQVTRQNGSAASRFRLAAAYVAAGQHAEARAQVNKAVLEHPEVAAQAAEFMKHIPGG